MDVQLLARFSPEAVKFRQGLELAITDADLATHDRLTMFLAQCAHESGGFSSVSENLNYRADVLASKLKKYFTPEQAAEYAHKPERIANRIYANRNGNGDESSGDGWKFRGRGLIQLTGRKNYTEYSRDLYGDDRVLSHPESLETPTFAARSAAWYWRRNQLNRFADSGDFIGLTRAINGGTNGLDDRQQWLRRAQKIWMLGS